MTAPSPFHSLPRKGAECRGSKSACADLDGANASRVSRLAFRTFGTAGQN